MVAADCGDWRGVKSAHVAIDFARGLATSECFGEDGIGACGDRVGRIE